MDERDHQAVDEAVELVGIGEGESELGFIPVDERDLVITDLDGAELVGLESLPGDEYGVHCS